MTLGLLRATWQSFNDDKAQRLAAAVAFSTIFSIAPLFVVLIAVAGGILGAGGHANVENALLAQIRSNAGDDAAQTVRKLIETGFNKPHQSAIAQAVGWTSFAFTASNLFASLQDALNAVWGVDTSKIGWRQLVRDRVASFGMIVVVGFLLLVTFVANAVIAIVGTYFLSRLPYGTNPVVISAIDQAVSLAIITFIFALVFKVLPDAKVAWRDVWIGAGVTAVLFIVGEALIALYIAWSVASAYGAAGSILVAMVWIYYSAMIMLLGAEFTKVYARRSSGKAA